MFWIVVAGVLWTALAVTQARFEMADRDRKRAWRKRDAEQEAYLHRLELEELRDELEQLRSEREV